MTYDQALVEVAKITPRGRTPEVKRIGKSHKVGFSDTEWVYWMGTSDMGYPFAIEQMKKRLEKR